MATESDDRARIFKKIQSIFGRRIPTIIRGQKITASVGLYTFRFHFADPDVQLAELVAAADWAEKKIREAVGAFPEKLTIEVCRTEAELPPEGTGLSHFPGWIGGAFDGTIRVLADPLSQGAPHTLYVFLTHEMVHAALAVIEGEPLPCWFEEGLAVHMSQNLPGHYREALERALRGRGLFALAELKAPFTRLDEAQVPLAYAQARSVVEFLVKRMGDERRGAERLRTAISRAKRRGFLAMLKSESLTLSLLEQDWKRWAVRQLKAQAQ